MIGDKAKRLLSIHAGLWTEAYEESRKEALADLEALQAALAKSEAELEKTRLELNEARDLALERRGGKP